MRRLTTIAATLFTAILAGPLPAQEEKRPEREERREPKEKEARERRDDRDRGGPDRKLEELIDQISKLRRDAVEAKRRDELDRAKKNWGEADRLENELRRMMEGGPKPGPEGKERVTGLRDKAKALEREAKEHARDLQREAKNLKEKSEALEKEGRKDEAEKLRQTAKDLAVKSEHVASDLREKAENLRRESNEISRRLKEENAQRENRPRARGRGDGPDGPDGPPANRGRRPPDDGRDRGRGGDDLDRSRGRDEGPRPPGPIGPPPAELQREIERLRKEVGELRDLLKRSLEERPRGRDEGKRAF